MEYLLKDKKTSCDTCGLAIFQLGFGLARKSGTKDNDISQIRDAVRKRCGSSKSGFCESCALPDTGFPLVLTRFFRLPMLPRLYRPTCTGESVNHQDERCRSCMPQVQRQACSLSLDGRCSVNLVVFHVKSLPWERSRPPLGRSCLCQLVSGPHESLDRVTTTKLSIQGDGRLSHRRIRSVCLHYQPPCCHTLVQPA